MTLQEAIDAYNEASDAETRAKWAAEIARLDPAPFAVRTTQHMGMALPETDAASE